MSGNRRAAELRPVPEDRDSSVHGRTASAQRTATLGRGTSGSGLDRNTSVSGIGNSIAQTGSGGHAGSSTNGGPNLATISQAHSGKLLGRTTRGQGMGGLSRTSIMHKIQNGGRQLIDLGKLQSNWLKVTLVKRSEAQDYVNEEDQGLVALLARHVDVPAGAWAKLLAASGAAADGQFWQTGLAAVTDYHRASALATAVEEDAEEEEEHPGRAAEAGRARAPERVPRRSIYYLPVINPYNVFAVIWTFVILLLDLVYTAFWVPMNVAFCTSEYGNIHSGCTVSDLVGGIFYFANCLLGFQIGVVATHGYRKRTVVDGRHVAWLYALYGRFWLDFVASVPFLYLVVVLAGDFRLNKGWVNCLSLLRLLRLLRVVSISRVVYMDSLSGRFQDSAVSRRLSVTFIYSLFLAYQLAVAINLLACIMVLCAYFEGYENSWMVSISWGDVVNASTIYQWYAAVYWMIVTTTTTGFGDFTPRQVAEQVVANVAMVGGMVMFGVLVASIGNALARATAEAHQVYGSRRKIMHVMEWAEHRQLPAEICKQVQNFYADKYGRKEEDAVDMAVMAELPSRLRAKVARAMCVPLMADCHILMELPEDMQTLLAEHMRPLRLPAGEDLCQQGDIADCFWILQDGTVQAVRYKEGSVTLDASESPRLLGESVLLGDVVEPCRVRPWTLRTVSPCRLWGITVGELYPLLRMYPAIGVLAAEYVKYKSVYSFNGDSDDHWCELAAVMVKQLQDRTAPEDAAEIVRDLFRTSAETNSLQALLDVLLTFCTSRQGSTAPAHGGGGGGGVGAPTLTVAALRQALAEAAAEDRPGAAAALAAMGVASAFARASASGGGPARGSGHLEPEISAPPAPPGPPPPAAASAFMTAAAAASLTAALSGVPTAAGDPTSPLPGRGSGPGVGAGGGYAAGACGSAFAAPAVQAGFSLSRSGGGPLSPTAAAPTTAAGAVVCGPGGAVTCSGCQRCVCPSCGQGYDDNVTGAGGAATAAATNTNTINPTAAVALLQQQGINARPTAGPGMRAWVNRQSTLRRVSVGLRPDAAWAGERKSFDRRERLGTMSIVPTYD
ncbi:hypothetical protein HYH03_016049 [Edaphochlamys debaryana]|uniref:Cyclic nucleotide-binding domain-containing protein n=1 Tax=Edaphochlamys debaryana TaxID=47281 RepID=A0A835XKI8_9CHLO|nr:hypothetical protein HYH03_016049 [Edaphochlamys debaryana]|eukprot:KAG2485159.1 hypothetical protein HYH03_016049 [Edaphochlamys debaryana]